MEEFTYEAIRVKALREGVKDTKLHVGIWAQFNGYMKRRVHRNGRHYTVYSPLQKLAC